MHGARRVNFTDPNFEDIRSQSHSLQGLAEYRAISESVSGGSEPTRTMVAAVSSDFFPIMHVQPVLGRGFAPDEQHFGAAPTALVSYAYWQQYLGSVTDLSAVKLNIENRAVSVIGVLPPGFRFPDDSNIWMPRELNQRLPSRSAHNWQCAGAPARRDCSRTGAGRAGIDCPPDPPAVRTRCGHDRRCCVSSAGCHDH